MRFLFVGPKLCPCWHFSAFTSGFLQIPPRDGHPCLRLAVPATESAVDFHHLVIAHAGRTAKNSRNLTVSGIHLEVTPGFEPGNQGFADPCLTAWLCRRKNQMHRADDLIKALKAILSAVGADDEARTRYLHLGKVALYQMSYIRICAVCTAKNLATRNGFEPSTSSVTG